MNTKTKAVQQASEKQRCIRYEETRWVNQQQGIPAHYGGLGLRIPDETTASAAYWATADWHATVLPKILEQTGRLALLRSLTAIRV